MTRDASRPRALPAVMALTSLAAVSLSACSWTSPVQTDRSYAPGDGIDVSLGSVKVTNLALVSSAKDQPAAVIGQVTNNSDQEAEIALATGVGGSGSVTTKVPAHQIVRLEDSHVTLPDVAQAPGTLTKISVATASSGQEIVSVPVLAPQGPYASISPTTSAPTSTPAAAPTTAHPATSTPAAAPTTAHPAKPAPKGTVTKTATPSKSTTPTASKTH